SCCRWLSSRRRWGRVGKGGLLTAEFAQARSAVPTALGIRVSKTRGHGGSNCFDLIEAWGRLCPPYQFRILRQVKHSSPVFAGCCAAAVASCRALPLCSPSPLLRRPCP